LYGAQNKMGFEPPFSKDYHDYVFKDGRLVGQFEAMYRHADGAPWHQDQQTDWLDIRLAIEMLRGDAPFARIHDFGCGLGYYLDLLGRALGTRDCRFSGSDISPTACAKAKELFPHATFGVQDLMAPPSASQSAEAGRGHEKALLSFRGSIWYVYPQIENVVANIAAAAGASDTLLVVQNFPPLNSTFVGKDVMPDPQSLVRWFSSSFQCTRSIWSEDLQSAGNDNWFLGLFKKK
jgi:SAM-dependent methyltransferase